MSRFLKSKMFKLRAVGIQEFILANKKMIKRLQDGTDFEEMLNEIVELARERCPVKTGNMEKSIRWIKRGTGNYVIICDVPYSRFIEYGSRYFSIGSVESPRKYKSTSGKMASVPFMRSSCWDVQRKFPDKMFRTIDILYRG